ncbi:MAG: hypothetical protein AAGH68_08890 [Pseudomonadota bacterium]
MRFIELNTRTRAARLFDKISGEQLAGDPELAFLSASVLDHVLDRLRTLLTEASAETLQLTLYALDGYQAGVRAMGYELVTAGAEDGAQPYLKFHVSALQCREVMIPTGIPVEHPTNPDFLTASAAAMDELVTGLRDIAGSASAEDLASMISTADLTSVIERGGYTFNA